MEITREQLADVLVRLGQIGIKGIEQSCGNSYGTIQYPDAVADCIFGFLRDGTFPRDGAEDVVGAHVCCEHVAGDPELTAMAVIARELDDLDLSARTRVLAYVADRFGIDL